MAKNRFNHSWLHDHINDPYVKLAQKHGYRARAAFKLKEIDEQDRLIRPGMTIVDLGAAPGSWSQYLREKLKQTSDAEMGHALGKAVSKLNGGINGRIIALDLLPMEEIADVTFIQGDFRDEEIMKLLEQAVGMKNIANLQRTVDLVLSDMAPNLSGIADADAARMEHVIELALEFAQQHLKPSGALLVKAFHGKGYSQIIEVFKRQFVTVVPRKPKASRDKSAEVFVLGRTLKRITQSA